MPIGLTGSRSIPYPTLMSVKVFCPLILAVSAAHADIVTPTLNWDAGLDTGGDAQWVSSVNSGGNTSFNFANGAQTPTDVSASSNFPGIQQAYSMPGARGGAVTFDAITIPSGTNASIQDASFELIFRPVDLDNNYFLFETGGNGSGLGIFTRGTDLVFRAQTSATDEGDAEVTHTLTPDDLNQFHQVVGTINVDAAAGNNSIFLYLNGSLIGTDSATGVLSDFAGGDTSGLGTLGGGSLTGIDNSLVGTTFTNFNGDIAALRYYDRELTQAEVEQNFDAITEDPNLGLITSFTSDRSTSSPGNPATLSWEVADPLDSLELDDGNGNITDLLPITSAGMGSTMVTPSETTTYTLTALLGGSKQTSRIQIVSGEAPTISLFNASGTFISQGATVDLTWEVLGAETLTLVPGATDVTGTTTISLTPTESTTYTLTATNSFGSTNAEIAVEVLPGPIPIHRNVASFSGNSNGTWIDQIGLRNWNMTDATLNPTLATPSANTNITAAYTTSGGITTGGTTTSFQYSEVTIELWFRPGNLTADHQVIFETGGGQNGVSALITESTLRLMGTTLDVRNLDVTIPIDGLNLDDFLQLIITNNADTDAYNATLRDTFGNVRSVSETSDVSIGVNAAGLFVWAAGPLGGASLNLGGSTDAAAAAPAGLTGFEGEIAILNIYDSVLDPADQQAAFDRVATIGSGPAGLIITDVSFNDPTDELTITWNSINGQSYLVEFSTSLQTEDWFELAGPFTADSETTTETLNLPPNQSRFFVRVIVDRP